MVDPTISARRPLSPPRVGGSGRDSVPPARAADAAETGRPEQATQVKKVEEKPLGKEELAQIRQEIEMLNQEFQRFGVEMKMEPQEGMDPAIVRVHDVNSGELIRQIPAREWLVLRKNLAEGRGLILDKQA
ncbi:MAG: flagellar protein FlaG [Myxococcota bacterium]|nr:hypothetical protein [Myxococcales bacterium]MEC7750693.1 flagellar protein FlaG [Myxococcota bacterium]|tara:strand:- start:2953 stop:3345 length:393 start_codon:yes stop_codon:yes gene_type:complete